MFTGKWLIRRVALRFTPETRYMWGVALRFTPETRYMWIVIRGTLPQARYFETWQEATQFVCNHYGVSRS